MSIIAEARTRQNQHFFSTLLEVAADDPAVLANTAQALAYFGEDIGTMTALVDRALALNSNFARGWLVSGTLRLWAASPTSQSSMLKPRCASVPASAPARCSL
jgi:hypothetical protein